MALKSGQRVTFRPTHAKEQKLTGKVKRVHKGGDAVDVTSDADNGSVSRVYTVHADDVTAIEEESDEETESGQEGSNAEEEESEETEESGAE